MCSPTITQPSRLTAGLVDRLTGWAFALHSDERRVWVDARGTATPVPLVYVAGARSLALEAAAAQCLDVAQLLAVAREILPPRIAVVPIEALDLSLLSETAAV